MAEERLRDSGCEWESFVFYLSKDNSRLTENRGTSTVPVDRISTESFPPDLIQRPLEYLGHGTRWH